jgi:Tfp pilus assembly protein FimV
VSLMLAAGVGASLVTFATGSDVSASSSTVTYTVQPGDTLWSIAGRLQPKADRRDTVATLLQINPTAAGGLDAGQALRVPQQ